MSETDSRRVLVVDVGNTRVKFGVFEVSDSDVPKAISIEARVLQDVISLSETLKQWANSFNEGRFHAALLAGSEVDQRDQLLAQWPLADCPPILISRFDQIPVRVDVEFPERVGIDRLLDTFAAWTLSGRHHDVIAVDSGTATTVDLLTADGIFRGGSILPGLRLSALAMHEYTARLPLLDTDREIIDLPQLPGRNTHDAMLSGLFIGQLGAVRELVKRLTEVRNQFHPAQYASRPESLHLYVTGGGGRHLVKHLPGARYVDSLALYGLAILAANH